MNRKILAIFLTLALVLTALPAFAQSYDVSVYIENTEVNFPDQEPFIDTNNRTLVPVRFIAEDMGANVEWDGGQRLVTIEHEGTEIELAVGEQRALVDGSWVTFDTEAVIVGERTMVPLRFISETLGAEVEWDGNLRRVDIYTEDPAEEPDDETGSELPPVDQRTPESPETENLSLPRHDESYPIVQEWIDSIRIEDGYISGRVPDNIPDDELWYRMSLVNHPDIMPGMDIQLGESFSYRITTDRGSLSFRVGERGNSETKSGVSIRLPSGEVGWVNK